MSIQRCCFVLLALLLLGGMSRPAAAQALLAPVYNPSNGHWYQAVPVPGGVAWPTARAAAAALSYAGYPGHLVTITSAAETQFLVGSLPLWLDDHWRVGGYQDTTGPDYSEPAGGWRWLTGEPWSYTHWRGGEPNNVGGENFLEIHSDGTWNDTNDQAGGGGYIVEYEPALPGPAAAAQLAIAPNPVIGGQPATGQVTLSQPAGVGGVIVTLASSNPAVAVVPAVVTVPAGGFTVAFPVITFPVATPTSVTISAGCDFGIASVTLQVTAAGLPLPTVNGTATPPVYNPANGHWYQEVRLPNKITWPDARAAAEQLSFAGFPGHLATVTSAAENQFVSTYMTAAGPLGDIWIGGYQDHNAPDFSEPAGGWRWVTGEPWSYTSWTQREPNNGSGGEDVLETNSGGTWNDLIPAPGVTAYLIEYEPPSVPAPANSAQLVLFPNPVPGGLLALGQVILAQPAGPGGAVVSLASSNPAAALVPAAVTVLPGAGTATFPIFTFPVATPASVLVTAGGAFGSAAATLQVLPLSTPLPPAPSASNLLVNGSFEEPRGDRFGVGGSVPGWRILQGTIDILTNSYWQSAPDGGSQSIDLNGASVGTIEQSFPTVPGQDYLFSGYVSHNPSVAYGRANVFLNGAFFTRLAHEIPNTGPDMQWQPFTYRFRATAAATTLTLSDVTNINDTQGTVLDGLSVTLAPDQNPPTVAPAGSPDTAPAAPTGLAIFLLGTDRVALTWTDNSSNEADFAIWRQSGGSDWARVGLVRPNITSFTDTALARGTTYTYRVRATNQFASDWSNEVTVTTLP